MLLATPLRRFLPPSGSITSVSTEGNLLLCSSHLALGVPTKCPTSTLGARIRELLPHHGSQPRRWRWWWRWIRGQFPVPAGCWNRDLCPPNLLFDGDGAAE